MKTAFTALALFVALTLTSSAQAQTPDDPAPSGRTQFRTSDTSELQKDPVVATYLSATVPGLGQIYTGDKKRGLLFLASIIGAFGAAYASYEPALLHLADYDRTAYGGNGDGLLSTAEADNWQHRRSEDAAFDRLSTGRKAGLVTGAAAGVGLYIWNVLDARRRAHDHNRQLVERRISIGFQAGPDRAGVAVGVNF
jgi:TM2 domain-containing membrane protein YozV